jgi:hypothetical protein
MMKHASTWLLGVLLGVAAACALDDELEDAECKSNADCWTNQVCVKTMMIEELDLSGLCRPKGSTCVKGEQLGCACAIDDIGTRVCTNYDLTKSADDETCTCVAPDATT